MIRGRDACQEQPVAENHFLMQNYQHSYVQTSSCHLCRGPAAAVGSCLLVLWLQASGFLKGGDNVPWPRAEVARLLAPLLQHTLRSRVLGLSQVFQRILRAWVRWEIFQIGLS